LNVSADRCHSIGRSAAAPDTVLKLYPSQIFTQAMIDAASEIAERIGVGGPGFASITIRTFDRAVEIVGGHGKTGDHALNRETADHSAAFCVAAMPTRRRLGYREFGTFLHDEDVLALMSRVHVADIGQAADAYPREQPCALDVELTDGRRLSARRSGPPVMDTASLQAKLDDLWPASSARNWPWTCPGTAPAFPDAPVRFAGPTSAKAGGH
jgi:2-methylcitrate dehydratase PrpD